VFSALSMLSSWEHDQTRMISDRRMNGEIEHCRLAPPTRLSWRIVRHMGIGSILPIPLQTC
jgi:hypothetical protein